MIILQIGNKSRNLTFFAYFYFFVYYFQLDLKNFNCIFKKK